MASHSDGQKESDAQPRYRDPKDPPQTKYWEQLKNPGFDSLLKRGGYIPLRRGLDYQPRSPQTHMTVSHISREDQDSDIQEEIEARRRDLQGVPNPP